MKEIKLYTTEKCECGKQSSSDTMRIDPEGNWTCSSCLEDLMTENESPENHIDWLEEDGEMYTSDKEEWYAHLKITRYAMEHHIENMVAYIVRNKETGKYNYVIVDNFTQVKVIETRSLDKAVAKMKSLK